VDAYLERCTELGDGSTPSQTDVLAILRLPDEIAIMAVEGKVDESFGPLVSDWLREAAPASKKPARLKRLAETLGIDVSVCETLRYQLLHRTASAIYEARRYHAGRRGRDDRGAWTPCPQGRIYTLAETGPGLSRPAQSQKRKCLPVGARQQTGQICLAHGQRQLPQIVTIKFSRM
jgi:hypothetical protein